MLSKPDQVVVTPAEYSALALHGAEAYHRSFPEVRGEGDSPEDAAARLADLLARTLDSAPSRWRREHLEQAIEDVRAFVNRGQA